MDDPIYKITKFKNTKEVKAFLSEAFWSGKRWVAYQAFTPSFSIRLVCFEAYEQALAFCRVPRNMQKRYKINAISFLLRFLNQVKQAEASRQKELVERLLALYPIIPSGSRSSFVGNLLDGAYYPVLWSRFVLPLTHIHVYSVQSEDGKKGGRTLYEGPDFFTALDVFQKAVSGVLHVGDTLLCISLSGGMDIKPHGLQEKNLVFYLFEKEKEGYRLRQLNDPAELLWLPVVQFVRYHAEKQCISFYDGKLRKALPGASSEYLNCSDFDYEQQFKSCWRR